MRTGPPVKRACYHCLAQQLMFCPPEPLRLLSTISGSPLCCQLQLPAPFCCRSPHPRYDTFGSAVPGHGLSQEQPRTPPSASSYQQVCDAAAAADLSVQSHTQASQLFDISDSEVDIGYSGRTIVQLEEDGTPFTASLVASGVVLVGLVQALRSVQQPGETITVVQVQVRSGGWVTHADVSGS